MGIKKLNNYLLNQCSDHAISRVPLSTFKGKNVVIDTSIYIYKFLSEDALLDNFYLMLSVFKQYQITPIFVFDGKPPPEKCEVIWERINKRKEAEDKYNEMVEELNILELSDMDKQKKLEKLSGLKRQFVRVTDEHIQTLKQLFSNLSIQYIDAPSEADLMCAYLVKTRKVYACISDDMDMFAYDCPHIIRKLSLIHHNCISYHVNTIKQELEVYDDLQSTIILCGTDYNTDISWDIQIALDRCKFYNNEKERKQTTLGFYDWLLERCFIDAQQKEKLDHVYSMFQVPKNMNIVHNIKQKSWTIIQPILEKEGFVFAN